MSQQPYIPPGVVPERPAPVDYEHLPETGVRKVLDAYVDRDRQWTRWGGVIAGLFVTAGSTILLSMLGLAFGVSALNPLSPSGFGVGTAIWWGVQSLLCLFLGGFAAARLGGSIRRSDGVVAGLLTWCVSLVGFLSFLGSVASVAVTGAAGAAGAAANVPGAVPPAGSMQVTPGQAIAGTQVAAGVLWYLFAITALCLVTAIIGGAVGAAAKLARRHAHA